MDIEKYPRRFFVRLGWAALAFCLAALVFVLVLPISDQQRWGLVALLAVYGALVLSKLYSGLTRRLPRNIVVYGSIFVDTVILAALDYMVEPLDLSPMFVVIILISATVAGRNAALVAALSASAAQTVITFAWTPASAAVITQLGIRSAVYVITALLVSELASNLTERWRTVAREAEQQRAEIAHRRDELEGLNEISQAFASLENEPETFRQVTKRIAHLLDADVCAIARIDDEGSIVYGVPPGYGLGDDAIKGFRYSITDEIAALWDFKSKYLILNDLVNLPAPLTQITSPLNVRHAVVARMGRRGRPVGLIIAANRKENGGFEEKDAQLLSILAGQAAVALENARLYAVAQENLQNLTRLYAISSQLAARSDPDAITTRIVWAVAEALNAPFSSMALLNQAGTLYYAAWIGIPDEVRQLGFRENGVAMTVIRSGTPRFIEDVRTAKDANPVIREWGVRASACLPIQHSDKRLGVLYVDFSEPHVYTPTEKSMLAIFANHAAIALEDARLHRFEQRRAKELEAVSRLSGSLAETMELNEMLRVIEREILTAFPMANAGALLVFDQGKDVLTPLVHFGLDRRALAQVALRPDEGVPGLVFQSGKPVLLAGPSAAETVRGTTSHENQSRLFTSTTGPSFPTSLICVPVSPGGERLGTFILASFENPDAFTTEDLHLLEIMADRAALAIRNAQLFAGGMRRATQLDTVAQVARRVASILDLGELLPTVADLIHTQFGYRYVHVFINDAERRVSQFRAGAGAAADEMAKAGITVSFGRGIVGWVAEQCQVLLANNALQEPRFDKHPLLPDTRAELAIPLQAGSRAIGVLDVQSEHVNAFEPSDVTTLETLAGQIAIAIENALLYGEVQEQARRDSLTRVYNHGYFLQRLNEEVEKAARTLCPLTLVMMDLDYFKEYNDQYGHVVGDLVLEATVQAIRTHVHRTDVVGRWGGEEFGVALLNTDPPTGRLIAERIRSTLQGASLTTKEGKDIVPPTVSQGLATFPIDAKDTAALIDLADGALYQAKSRGRDQICAASG